MYIDSHLVISYRNVPYIFWYKFVIHFIQIIHYTFITFISFIIHFKQHWRAWAVIQRKKSHAICPDEGRSKMLYALCGNSLPVFKIKAI